MRMIMLGTDTDVGKTWITTGLAWALRQRRHAVWLHKPVACGDWDGSASADGRTLRALAGDEQPLATVCPREYPEACSPHLAARAANADLALDDLITTARAVDAQAGPRHLLLETAGGLLAPICRERRTNRELALALGWPCLLVTRPDLGTLNHTALTVAAARAVGLPLQGLIVNHHHPTRPTIAVRSAATELTALTGLPVLAEVVHGALPATWADGVLDRLLQA